MQFQPGQSGNPAGKPKGAKHISTWIQELLNNEEFEATILDSKNGVKEYSGAPLKAIIGVAITKSLNGDNKWAEWLAKHGYGEKLTLANDVESPININQPVSQDLLQAFIATVKDDTKQK